MNYLTGKGLPRLLNEMPDKPKGLYVVGNEELLHRPDLTYICIIGSRKYTQYGLDACRELIAGLRGKAVAIVSGLALGIDGIAHRTALEAGIPCIAVPGSGLDPDVLYPRSHVELARDIVDAGGVLVSEFEPGFRATPWAFPMRNRIMAGLSHAVLIIEGEEDSGTLITARLALEYDRGVLAVPGSIFSSASLGPLNLIKKGAVPICCVRDLLDALNLKEDLILHDEAAEHEKYRQCSKEELLIIQSLKEPQSRDALLNLTGLELSRMLVLLSTLEIRGLIVEEFGLVRISRRRKEYF